MKMPNRKLTLLFALFIFTAKSFAQQAPSPKTLLWRISGNGLQQPSYLYGSFHLTDKQLFNFGDSVYAAIEHSKGLAIELDPEEMVPAISDMADIKNQRLVTNILSPNQQEELAPHIEEVTGKKMAIVTEADIINYRSKWMYSEMFTGDDKMTTYMDGYLYARARDMGKWVGGIEDPEDQAPLSGEQLSAEEIEQIVLANYNDMSYLDKMKKVYVNQDLDAIQGMINSEMGDQDTYSVSKRNIKMARRMDSLSRIRNTFFVIGAAHLPGDSGVIHLLKNRGFQLEPVFSSKKIAATDYNFKKVLNSWVRISDEYSLFTIEMPGTPQEMPVPNATLNMYNDPASLNYYFMATFPMADLDVVEEQAFKGMIDRFAEKAINLTTTKIERQQTAGREFYYEQDNHHVKMQVYLQSSGIVMAMAMSQTKEKLYEDTDIDRFFNSMVLNTEKKLLPNDFRTYTYPEHAFKVDFPAKPIIKPLEQGEDNPWKVLLFDVVNGTTGDEYVVFVRDLEQGYYVQGDRHSLIELAELTVTNLGGTASNSKDTIFQGFPAIYTTATLSINKTKGLLQGFYFFRNNRTYSVLSFTRDNKESRANAKRFLESFELIDYQAPDWNYRLSPDEVFLGWFPGDLVKKESEEEESISIVYDQYESFDATIPSTLHIDRYVFSPYYWNNNDTAVFDQFIDLLTADDDSLIYKKYFTAHGFPAVETESLRPGAAVGTRMRLLLHADTLYAIYTYLSPGQFEMKNYENLFKEFKPTGNLSHASTLFTNKANLLLNDLANGDSIQFAKAFDTFDMISFQPENLPALRKALLHQYPDFDGSYSAQAGQSIMDIILDLDTNFHFILWIDSIYQTLTGEQEKLKPWLLNLLMETPTTESFSLLKKLLITAPPKVENVYYLKNTLYDSLGQSMVLFPEILQLADDPGMHRMVTYLAGSMLDSGFIDCSTLLPYSQQFISQARNALKNEEDLKELPYAFHDLLNILSVLATEETNELLQQFLQVDEKTLNLKAAMYLLKNKQTVSPEVFQMLASSLEFRSQLYEALKEADHAQLFPNEFLSPEMIAQSEIFNRALDNDYPVSVQLIGDRKIKIDKKNQQVLLFKIEFNQSTYLGIAFGYDNKKNKISTSHDYTGIFWDEEFDESLLDDQLKSYLEQFKN